MTSSDTNRPHATAPNPSTPQKSSATEARDMARGAAHEAKDALHDAAAAAKEEAAARVEGARASVAGEVDSVADALRTAAEEMRRGSIQERSFAQIADGLADASEAIRQKDLGEIARDLSDFARRNPFVFLGGAALVGFAATRFARASSERPVPAPRSHPAYGTTSGATAASARPASATSTPNRAGEF
jgi:hypothetical protein